MSFGCIPVVLSDGWVLPFDRSIEWSQAAVVVPEACAAHTPALLRTFSPERIGCMARHVGEVWQRRLASLDAMVDTLLVEVEVLAQKT